jgi:anti-sigma factor RsiW
MVDQTNFETWFFMYADNELSADERWEVEEFVRKNPSCQKEFDSIQRLQFHPEQVAFPDKSVLLADQMSLNDLRFEADTSIVYPFKQELYRQMSLGKKRSYYSMAIAASMLLLVGLFFLFNQQEQIPTSLPVTKNIVQGSLAAPQNSLASNTVPSKSEKLTNIVSSRRTKKIQLAVAEELVLQVEEPVIVPEMESKSEDTVVIASTPSSNLSEEALRAAAYRMASPAPTQPDAVSINTAMIIEASAKSTEQGRLRGLVRKLSRQLFKEKETDDQKKYIQVASFAIPVSNKK